MIIKTRLLFWADGFALNSKIIVVKPGFEGNTPLIEHEKVHQKQMANDGWFVFVWRYFTSPKWRLFYEASAYKVSIKLGMPIDFAANILSSNYFLVIPKNEAIKALSDENTNNS